MMSFFYRSVLILSLMVLVAACDNPAGLNPLRPNDNILAFGDSLTTGTGADVNTSYTAQLQRLIGRNIINAGIPGEVSADGARRLPGLLDTHNPSLVLIMHGGNDLLQKRDEQQLKENLRRMYEAANQRNIQVAFIAVPRPGLMIKDAPVYKELADELGAQLLEGALSDLMKTDVYKSDAVHLNAAGYEALARKIADFLKLKGAI
jgi:lysophospholipase L1-like esterase